MSSSLGSAMRTQSNQHSLNSNATSIRALQVSKRSLQKKQSGATIVEILVAVLILSFGLLGMAALQTRALQGNQSSFQRSQAIMLVNYIMDAMRIDRENARGGNYNINNVCGSAGISGTTLDKNNLREWLEASANNLGGNAESPVCGSVVCNVNYSCTVTIQWDDSKIGGLTNQRVVITSTI
jgi:type IV pilus assembly protein PilV